MCVGGGGGGGGAEGGCKSRDEGLACVREMSVDSALDELISFGREEGRKTTDKLTSYVLTPHPRDPSRHHHASSPRPPTTLSTLCSSASFELIEFGTPLTSLHWLIPRWSYPPPPPRAHFPPTPPSTPPPCLNLKLLFFFLALLLRSISVSFDNICICTDESLGEVTPRRLPPPPPPARPALPPSPPAPRPTPPPPPPFILFF